MKKCQNILTFFKRSDLATIKYNELLANNDPTPASILTSVDERWNSALHMWRRMLKLSREVNLLCNDVDLSRRSGAGVQELIYREEWELFRSLVLLLVPCEKTTRVLSGDDFPAFSFLYPAITGFLRTIIYQTFENNLLKATISCLINELSTRFIDSVWKPPSFVVTMALDPLFKFLLICKEAEKKQLMDQVKEILAEHVNELPQMVKDKYPPKISRTSLFASLGDHLDKNCQKADRKETERHLNSPSVDWLHRRI